MWNSSLSVLEQSRTCRKLLSLAKELVSSKQIQTWLKLWWTLSQRNYVFDVNCADNMSGMLFFLQDEVLKLKDSAFRGAKYSSFMAQYKKMYIRLAESACSALYSYIYIVLSMTSKNYTCVYKCLLVCLFM